MERICSISPEYVQFTIPKRSGGDRLIDAPCRDLRDLLRDVLRQLTPLSLSPFSFGVSRGAFCAASAHFDSSLIVRVDIKNFFSSVTFPRLVRTGVLRKVRLATGITNALARKLFFVRHGEDDVLPQGAPTSPILADLYLTTTDYRIARALVRLARHYDIPANAVAYTRYVDDLVVSVANTVPPSREFAHHSVRVIQEYLSHRGLDVARDKTLLKVTSKARSVIILGYSVLGKKLQTPRAVRMIARTLCWKVAHGDRLTRSERGTLGYAAFAGFRVPKRCITAFQDRSSPDANFILTVLNRGTVAQRDQYLSIPAILARGALKRLRNGAGINSHHRFDLRCAAEHGLLRINAEFAGVTFQPTASLFDSLRDETK
jgi:RNA-directed DNA polymerase